MEQVEEIRHTNGIKQIYNLRSRTIERVFADAKEKYGMRYTQYRGIDKVKMELNLLFGCMNLKKLATWLDRLGILPYRTSHYLSNFRLLYKFYSYIEKWFQNLNPEIILSTV